ncbi:DinB family protein [Anatilimnocola floriformis]|uniref:DinB family protein n=1 Tax=Anatilimnocola floriformis TaxID=2948575 RepID=UPI0020C24F5C|nr:DinB family protein [Anatilimnocola floriformis]
MELATLVSQSLRTLLKETMFHAEKHGGFLLNGGEPGMVATLQELSAEQASKPPGPGRKPIVSHANHVLFGWELLNRALQGENSFAGADWNAAWKLERVNDAEWQELLGKLEKNAAEILERAPRYTEWNEMMLTGTFASAAHTAYHLGAIRQMLREV